MRMKFVSENKRFVRNHSVDQHNIINSTFSLILAMKPPNDDFDANQHIRFVITFLKGKSNNPKKKKKTTYENKHLAIGFLCHAQTYSSYCFTHIKALGN